MKKLIPGVLLATCAFTLASPAALAQGTSTPLTGLNVFNISPDGLSAVGTDASGSIIWTLGTVTSIVGGAGYPEAVSAGGIIVGGEAQDPLLGQNAPAYWVSTSPTNWVSLGAHPSLGGGCPDNGSVYATSDDGSVLGGMLWDGCKTDAFTWTAAGGIVLHQDALDSARVNGVATDGSQSGGWIQTSTRQASLWDAAGTLTEPFAVSHPGSTSEIFAMGDAGNYTGWLNGGMFVMRDGVFTDVNALGGFSQSVGNGISNDGRVAVGWQGTSGPFGTQTALIHLDWMGPQDATSFFSQFGVTPPGGNPTFSQIVDVDATGNYFLAQAGGFPFSETVHISLPNSFASLGGATLGSNGFPELSGFGWLNPGMTAGLSLENAATGSIAVLIYGGAYNPVPLYGGIVGPFPWDGLLLFPTGANGEVEFTFTWPITMPSGVNLYTQMGVLDPAGTDGIVLSNNLQLTGN